jgi:hypothetical protein
MNVNHKKILRLVTLLITSLLIGLASAATYKYMYIDGSVNIGAQKLQWTKDGSTVSGDTVTVDWGDIEPGVGQNFSERLYLKNIDSASHNMTITVTTTVSGLTFDMFNIYIYKNSTGPTTWTYVDTLDVIAGDTYSTYTANAPLGENVCFRLDFEVKAKIGTSGPNNFDIKVQYE